MNHKHDMAENCSSSASDKQIDEQAVSRNVWRWRGKGEVVQSPDKLAAEEPLEIRVQSKAVCVTMRTPGNDEELAAGFVLAEAVVTCVDEISRIDPCAHVVDGGVLNVFLHPSVQVDFDKLTRHVFSSSSCGVCGKATIEAIVDRHEALSVEGPLFTGETIALLPEVMVTAQAVFHRTGGLHAAGLFDTDGKLVVLREDVGRHNAVDKVVGHALLGGIDMTNLLLVVSGRSSFEIVQKAIAARIPIVAAISAPTSLAVDLAEHGGVTLIGFLRQEQMNIYTHRQRVSG